MAFEKFERRSRPVSTEPVMAIQKRGTLSMNSAAHALLEEAGTNTDSDGRVHTELLFDPDQRLVGFRASDPGTATYPIRKQPKSDSYLVTGRAFANFYDIPVGEVRHFRARELGDGIVGFSLNDDQITE